MSDAAPVPCHFGEWLQGRNGPDGALLLLTLMGPDISVRAKAPHPAPVPPAILARFAEALGRPVPLLDLGADIPPGCGTGLSTAALVAHGRAAGVTDPATLARACLMAEGAVDPLMYDRPDTLLWAPRAATTVARLAPPVAQIVGGLWGPPTPTDPGDTAFPDISDLLRPWQNAAGDTASLAALAATSAQRTTALRGPTDDPTARLAAETGALGWTRAHTGSARALVFAPGTAPPDTADRLARAGFTDILTATTGHAP